MGEVDLVSSVVLIYENSRNRSPLRRRWVEQCLAMASQLQKVDQEVTQRAKILESQGLKPVDALHVACSEMAGCDYFLTCDDRLMRRYTGALQVMNPVSFVLDMTGEPE